MRYDVFTKASKLNKEHHHKKRWYQVMTVLASIVVFCTTYALILPAITMEAPRVLACPLAVHQHTADCYDENGDIICGQAGFVLHTHDASCYDADGNLVCTLPEIEGHEHTENCYSPAGELICGQEELLLHTHTDGCYDSSGSLICGQMEVLEHVHTDECFRGTVYTYEDDALSVTAVLPEGSAVPGDAVLTVRPVTAGDETYNYEELTQQAAETVSGAAGQIVLYDISFYTPDEEYIPVSDAATVSIRFKEAVLSQSAGEVTVLHYEEDAAVPVPLDKVAVGRNKNDALSALTFQTEGFSVFAVVTVTGNGYEAVTDVSDLEGKSFVILSHTGKYAMLAQEATTQQIGKTSLERSSDALTVASDLSSYQIWEFEKAEDGDSNYYIHSGDSYIKMSDTPNGDNRDLTLVSKDDASVFELTVENTSYVAFKSNGCYINLYGGEGNPDYGKFRGYTQLDDGSRLLLYQKIEPAAGEIPVTELGGKSFAIYNKTTKVAMTTTAMTVDGANGLACTPAAYSTLDGVDQISGSNIAVWTFEATDEAAVYYISTQVGSEKKYLNLTENSTGDLTLTDTAQKITVIASTGGQVLLKGTSGYVNSSGSSSYNFWVYNGTGNNSLQTLCQVVERNGLTYDATVTPVQIGVYSSQTLTQPTVNGSTMYNQDPIPFDDAGNYTVLAPSTEMVIADSGVNGKCYVYKFEGWAVNGDTNKIIQPGDVLTQDWFTTNGSAVTLTAQWSTLENGRIASVNYFVYLKCEVEGSEHTEAGATTLYTPSIHTSGVVQDTAVITDTDLLGSDEYLTIGDAAKKNPAERSEMNSQIRSLATTPQAGLLLDSFPSDEEALAAIRSMVENNQTTITIDDKAVPAANITPDVFTIRWYKVKYDSQDAWHIDGILVAKKGKLTVTKTFAGDADIIQKVKDDYRITVYDGDTSQNQPSTDTTPLYTLNLKEKSDTNPTGYDYYDAATDTYTWVLDVARGNQYTLNEENYVYLDEDNLWGTIARDMIINPDNAEDNTPWVQYFDHKAVVTAYAYSDDVTHLGYQTVSFRNTYVRIGTLSVFKMDGATKQGLSGVSFKITNADGAAVSLVQIPGTGFYTEFQKKQSDTAGSIYGEYTEPVNDGIVKTDATGNFYIELSPGTYYLEEEVPIGYIGATKIQVEVDDDGKVTSAVQVETSGGTYTDYVTFDPEAQLLTLKNYSELLTTVTAVKDWGDTPESERQSVTVRLMRNGVAVPGLSALELNKDNNWTGTWTGLPLFVDLELAVYSLRETQIGNSFFDPSADTDGYSDYIVSMDPALYRKDDDMDYGSDAYWPNPDPDASNPYIYSNQAKLVIHNSIDKGGVTLTKVDENGFAVSGAEFTLYDASNKVFQTAVSDDAGLVSFDSVPNGSYTLQETLTPFGYLTNNSSYTVTVIYGKATILNSAGNIISQVVNTTDKASLTIKKVEEKADGSAKEVLLSGAKFSLYQVVDGITQETKLVLNGQNEFRTYQGMVTLANIPAGTYAVREVEAPAGYKIAAGDFVFTVSQGGVRTSGTPPDGWEFDADTNIITVADKQADNIVTITTQKVWSGTAGKPVTLELYQVLSGSDTAKRILTIPLDGTAEEEPTDDPTQAYGYESAAWVATWQVPAYLLFQDDEGETSTTPYRYYVRELASEEGYTTSYQYSDLKTVTFVTLTLEDNTTVQAALTATEYTGRLDDVRTVVITNTAYFELPETGGSGTFPYAIGSTLLLAGSLLCGYLLRRRQERRYTG